MLERARHQRSYDSSPSISLFDQDRLILVDHTTALNPIQSSPVIASYSPEQHFQSHLSSDFLSFDQSLLSDLKKMLGDDADTTMQELFQNYLEDAPITINQLRMAVDRQDKSGIREFSHALRSASISLGAVRLSQLCKALESMGKDQVLASASLQLQSILLEYQNVESIIRRDFTVDP
jgi:HPt (histidine-containing phosphotransfer) domain-containing protein